MSIRRRFLAAALMALAAATVLLGTVYFSSQRPGYSQMTNTISELGETGAAQPRLVAFGFFLPVGLLVWLVLWLLQQETRGRDAALILLALSGLGTGYVVSAFFPCDPGAPLYGSWRTLVHNAAGLVDYGGTAAGFLLASACFARRKAIIPAVAFGVGGALGFVCLVLLCLPSAWAVRGAVQRVAEIIQFAGVFALCLLVRSGGGPYDGSFSVGK